MLSRQSKGVIIIGCSPFGAALANTSYHRGHKVVVLDKDRESFQYLPKEFDGSEPEGDPTDPRVLKKAGIERAGMITAATQDDNSNLLIPQIVSNISQMGCVYARLDGTNRCRLTTDMPIQLIGLYNLLVDDCKDLADSVSRGVAV